MVISPEDCANLERAPSSDDGLGADRATICQLLHGLTVGGAEVLAARLARQLRTNYRFIFVCLDELGTLGEQLRDEGFSVSVLGRRPGIDFRSIWRLAALLRRERVDIVHAHQYTPFFYGISARQFYRRPPVIFTEHGRWFPDYPRRKRMIANRLLLQSRDRVIAVGEHVRQALIVNEGIRGDRVSVIYNGVDMTPFEIDRYDSAAVRREMQVGRDELVILQVARLDALKDHATAIETLSLLVRQRSDVRLVLVGEGPELGSIQEMVRTRELQNYVRFMGLRRDVARLLAAADLFLLSSKSEGIPLTVIEAMAAGVPVVSTQVGGVAEIIEDGRSGSLAASGDAPGLAASILRLANEPALRERFRASGRDRAVALFSERQMHDAYLRVYRESFHDR